MLWSRCQNYLRPGAGAELILINTAVFTAVSLEVASSVADPERFNADPDPTFQADADPDPNFFTNRESKKKFLKIFTYAFQNINQILLSNFLSNNAL